MTDYRFEIRKIKNGILLDVLWYGGEFEKFTKLHDEYYFKDKKEAFHKIKRILNIK